MSERVDLLVRGTVVDVTAGILDDRTIAIDDGVIVSHTDRPADRVVEGAYVTPGLIDAHTHVEASMVTLPRYGEAMLPHGVTGIVHDPHEIANVLGDAGVRGFLAGTAHTPLKAYATAPSSVPASDLQDTGASLPPADVVSLLARDDVVALGEVMNTQAVLDGDPEVHAKIEAARNRDLTVDGHAPGVTGPDAEALAHYLDTDHESVALDEAREKGLAGFRVAIREGSSSQNLDELIGLLDEIDGRRLMLCTDGVDVAYAAEHGGVNVAVRNAITHGVDPVTAVQLATINVAETYDLPSGRLTPGAPADLVLLSDLESWDVEHVIVDGILDPSSDIEDSGQPTLDDETVRFDPLTPADVAISHDSDGPVTVRVVEPIGDFQTERRTANVPAIADVEGVDVRGVLGADVAEDVLPAAVIERHSGDGGIGRGFVHGLGLERGALGSTVAHDAHNCVVVGTTHDAMARVANHLREIGGGIAVYDPERDACTTLHLPIAGLVSDAPLDTVASSFRAVKDAAAAIGLDVPGGLLEITFLPLEVIPTYRLTNNGLVDAATSEYVDVVVE